MLAIRATSRFQSGTTMLEVLITLVILAFGLLGLAGLNAKIQLLELEAYQRAQAILLLKDMTERIRANSGNVASYVQASPVTTPYGTGYTPTCPGATQAARDICEWSNALQGAAESSSGNRVGAMIGARGCVEQVTAPNPAAGVCLPGSYRITVAWQGMSATTTPSLGCGATQYGANDAVRRAIATQIVIGLPSCI